MTPIAISNQRPGFVPFSARPLVIAGRSTFAPRANTQSAYRPAPYRPPMLANQTKNPQMGIGGFSFSDVPLTLTLGVAGAAALVLSSVVPSPVKELTTVAGLGLIAFGVLNLFSAPAAAAEAPTPATGNKPFTVAEVDAFNKVTAKVIKPSWNEEVNRGLFSKDYDIEVLWTNGSDKNITVPYRIYVEEKPQMGVGTSEFRGVAYTGQVSLGPKQSVQVPLEIDLQYRSFIGALAVGIMLKVQKIAPGGEVIDLDQRSFIVY
jgi:hypothetical protein